jgi:hypothetical protein
MGLWNVEDGPGQSSCPLKGTGLALEDLPPAVPAPVGDPDAVQLFIRRAGEDDVNIGEPVSRADAREFCSRDDTHGPGWFIGYDRQ